MLKIVNQEHYNKVTAEATRLGLMPDLQEQLDYLAIYACHRLPDDVVVELGYDFAPLSFSLLWLRKNKSGEYVPWFNGGLIFHPGAAGVDQSFSVELVGSDKPHWSIHT